MCGGAQKAESEFVGVPHFDAGIARTTPMSNDGALPQL
jgi:hypothetical protein